MPGRSARPARGGPAPRAAPPPARADEALADALHSAAIHLLRAVRREDERSGLTGPRLSALSVVVFAGPVTLGELARAEQVRPPTMTRLVQALEAEGLVARAPDPADARVTRVHATARGRRLLAEGRARRVAALVRAIAPLRDDERDTLRRAAAILERLAAPAPESG